MEYGIVTDEALLDLIVKPHFVLRPTIEEMDVESAAVPVGLGQRGPSYGYPGCEGQAPAVNYFAFELERRLAGQVDPGPGLAPPLLERSAQHTPVAVEIVLPFNPRRGDLARRVASWPWKTSRRRYCFSCGVA